MSDSPRIGRPPKHPDDRRSQGTAVKFSHNELVEIDSMRGDESRADFLMRKARGGGDE